MPRVAFLILDAVHLLDLAGPVQVFSEACEMGADYQMIHCSTQPAVKSAQGLTLSDLVPLPDLGPGDLILVAGCRVGGNLRTLRCPPDEVLQWLQKHHRLGISITSVCSGAGVLGYAGLLSGRKCTTHHLLTSHLQEMFPKAKVQDNRLYVTDGNITTSAGIASGMDMALHFIEQQHGALFAAKLARDMVVYHRRQGMDLQDSLYLQYRAHLHSGVHRVQDFLIEHAHEQVPLAQLAELAHLSPRHLTRAFKEHTGLTPLQYQQRLRLEKARQLMQNRTLTVERIAELCGFEDARHFRRLYRELLGVSPREARALQV
ncbi:GlxA family transcriptional regulator [Deinococcus cellulosilyticus]|uniref:AraC family transcriptional regulator n=1 Tax=Deinococcus cellulosilyticus (strain DSM 18568 / NBRC 106333 / KACC 11606 / 5516J-15) TaxID=1223518 RepID=A0A511MX88_DEIC1|nr:GlxA family transcriptional regulator [Deinococcus cellulosilyticus]GEM44981.1 AraC family transcriptional regulator [Deinococcus cellulosilyticus NBRC 106333 = KACC 11606]